MWDKCPQCGLFFDTTGKLVKHVKEDHKKNIAQLYICPFCSKEYTLSEDLLHHLNLDHQGISSELLENGAQARKTKKNLPDYMGDTKKGTVFECCECFEMFSDADRLKSHRLKQHNMMLTPEAEKKVKELNAENPPQCNRCHRYFHAIITTKIENETQFVCLDCYEKYYGTNALEQLMIGTPDEILTKIRKPIN